MKKLLITLIILTVTAALFSCGVSVSENEDTADTSASDTACPVTDTETSVDSASAETETSDPQSMIPEDLRLIYLPATVKYFSEYDSSKFSTYKYEYTQNGTINSLSIYNGNGELSGAYSISYGEDGHISKLIYDHIIQTYKHDEYYFESQRLVKRISDEPYGKAHEECIYDENFDLVRVDFHFVYEDLDIISPTFTTLEAEYDENGNLTKVRTYSPERDYIGFYVETSFSEHTEYVYGDNGNITEIIQKNENGEIINSAKFYYDENGNRISEKNNTDYSYEYDDNGNVTRIYRADKLISEYTYNEFIISDQNYKELLFLKEFTSNSLLNDFIRFDEAFPPFFSDDLIY